MALMLEAGPGLIKGCLLDGGRESKGEGPGTESEKRASTMDGQTLVGKKKDW